MRVDTFNLRYVKRERERGRAGGRKRGRDGTMERGRKGEKGRGGQV